MPEPDNLVLHLLQEMREDIREVREDVRGVKGEMSEVRSEMRSLRGEVADVRSEVHSLRADVASDMLLMEKRMNDQFVTLRRSVMEYHSTAVGHGILYSELEERVRRIEQRLEISHEPH